MITTHWHNMDCFCFLAHVGVHIDVEWCLRIALLMGRNCVHEPQRAGDCQTDLDVRLQFSRGVIDEQLAQHVVKGSAAFLVSVGSY